MKNKEKSHGRTYEVPVTVVAGQPLSIVTNSLSGAIYDSILVLFAPDGPPVLGSDDENEYFAGCTWVAGATGTSRLWIASFESINPGELI